LITFRKPVEDIQISWKSDKKNGYLSWRVMCFYDSISLYSS